MASHVVAPAEPPRSRSGDALLRALRDGDSDAAVVCGETGSGKTTQVPQYLLDDAIERGEGSSCRVVCTQPRRVAALTVAERACAELVRGARRWRRREPRRAPRAARREGHEGHASDVHDRRHPARQDARRPLASRRVARGAGRNPRAQPGRRLPCWRSCATLPRRRRALNMRPLKLVVMSATLDAELFCGYLGNCTAVSAPGRTHPVTTVHLERIRPTCWSTP